MAKHCTRFHDKIYINVNKNLDDLLGLKKDKVLPENNGNHKHLADKFVMFFEEKTDKIYRSLTNENYGNTTFTAQHVQIRLRKFKELDMNEFKRIMSKTKYTYCENDPFPIRDVKDATNIDLLCNNYFKIVNMSLKQAVFPQSEKLGIIKPTYKGKGDKNDLSSYRPISNLSYLSKIIETAVNEQLWTHLKEIKIIPEDQSAYRENHSTETTLCSIMNDMIQITDDGKCGILVMLDLSAAFDTVVHELLLNDCKFIGIEGDVYRWLESYLQNREVAVAISNIMSEKRKLTKGVPQGSVLGPTLFIIYTIELSWILQKHNVKFKIYADDTQYYFSVTTTQNATEKIEEIMTDIRNWMIKKKLKLNENKTECMLFGTNATLKNYEQLQYVKIGSSNIKITPVVCNLGVLIDNKLTMKNQVLKTVKTCNYHLRNIAFISNLSLLQYIIYLSMSVCVCVCMCVRYMHLYVHAYSYKYINVCVCL